MSELAIIDTDAHALGVDIYMYQQGDVSYIGGGESFGTFRYFPHQNMIWHSHMGQGVEEAAVFRFDGGSEVLLHELHSGPKHSDTEFWEFEGTLVPAYDGSYYEVDGVTVSEEEYTAAKEAWRAGSSIWGYDSDSSIYVICQGC